MSSLMFTRTENIRKAVILINNLNTTKFPLLLSRIIQKLHLKNEHAFSGEELMKLENMFSINVRELEIVIETCEFFLHQAAYHTAKPAILQDQLLQLDLDQLKVDAFVTAWRNNAKDVVDKLRSRTLPTKQLDSVGWRLNLSLGCTGQTKMKSSNAVVELGLDNTDSECKEKLRMEFSHEELFRFYEQLETIQCQIDSLS